MPTLDSEYLLRLLSIIVIDLTVAGDNALVIALAVRGLPPRQQMLGRLWGTAGAVVLRIACIFIVTWLLKLPLLQFAGGLVLVWIAVKLVRQPTTHAETRDATSLREAIWIIIVADAAMSLDNVLAVAAAAHGDFGLALRGVALSIPIVVWGSGLVGRLMSRFPWTIWIGAGVLGWVAGEMIVADQMLKPWLGGLRFVVPAALAAGITALGWYTQRALERRAAA